MSDTGKKGWLEYLLSELFEDDAEPNDTDKKETGLLGFLGEFFEDKPEPSNANNNNINSSNNNKEKKEDLMNKENKGGADAFGYFMLAIMFLIGGFFVDWIFKGVISRPITVPVFEGAINNHNFNRAHKCVKWMGHMRDQSLYEDKLFNAEVSYLMNENSVNSSERVITLIANYGNYGSPFLGVADLEQKKLFEANEKYIMDVARYNQMLDGVLSRAISMKNQYLAEKVINFYQPSLKKSLYNDHLLRADEYLFEYSYEAKEKAEEIYRKAVEEKRFE